jgi:flagellar hook-associated protein 2
VTITLAASSTGVVNTVQNMVTDYNTFHSLLTKETQYDTTTNTASLLSDDPTAMQLDTQIPNLLSGLIGGSGSIQSLAQLGVTFNQDGSLAFDSTALQNQYASNPDAVKQFFTQSGSGLAVQLDNLIESLAGQTNSLLSQRMTSLSDMMQQNNDRITSLSNMLLDQRQRLYNQFYQMEVAIAQLQASMSIVNSLSLLSSDGTSTNIFNGINSSNSLSNLANIIGANATAQANAASSNSSG